MTAWNATVPLFLKIRRYGGGEGATMFKSLFAKYITAFVLIILISFSLIIGVITAIVTKYSEQAKLDVMETAARSAVTFLENKMIAEDTDDLLVLVEKEMADVGSMLAIASENADDLTVLLVNADRRVLIAAGQDSTEVMRGATIPQSLWDKVAQGDLLSDMQPIEGVLEEKHAMYTRPIFDAAGNLRGTVFICADSMLMADLLQAIVRGIIIAIVWVFLATLVAAYLISDRVVAPLKSISRAAKEFASGKFDSRVPVRGKDEIAELAVAFNSMAEAMDNYDTMRNTFMSNVSHDLRSPMTSISGFIDGILDGVIPPEKHHYYLQIVSAETHRLSRLVSSLLDLSRIQAGERKFTPSPFDICEMGREILISFEQKITEKALAVDFYCDEERMIAVADRDAIYQILYNLCDNAIKFSSDGGLLQISIVHGKGRKITVSVYNEGQGISPADLPYVFERFYKSDKSRGLNKTGVGLGLFISKTIMDAHGESIWVESEHGKNCCFHFTLAGE